MQRQVTGGIELACDFCGSTWDQIKPMIEGHRGSILCLDCLAKAIDEATESTDPFTCTMCRVEREPPMKVWRGTEGKELPGDELPGKELPGAVLCWDCTQQADRAFDKDAETQWTRRIPPTERWK